MEYATFYGIESIMEYRNTLFLQIVQIFVQKYLITSIMFMTRYYLLKFVFILDDINATCDIFGTTSQGQLDI